jgi:uncharacterized protein
VLGLLTVCLVGLAVGMLAGLQRQLIYFPDSTMVPSAGDVIEGARDITLRTSDGLALGAWFVPPSSASDMNMAVLVAPGNGGNRLGRLGLAAELSRRGLAVVLMDYRGYGGNPGSPSEDGLAKDAMAAAMRLEELGYPAERTIYFGESLGTGVVAALQAGRPPAGVVLRSPFTELADAAAHHYPWLPVRVLLKDRFPVTELTRYDVEDASAGAVGNGPSLARMFAALIGEVDGTRLISADLMNAARQPQASGRDVILRVRTDWGLGFALPGGPM